MTLEEARYMEEWAKRLHTQLGHFAATGGIMPSMTANALLARDAMGRVLADLYFIIDKDDADILSARCQHPIAGTLYFERVRQNGRIYYRMLPQHGSLTDADHARLTIAYWRERGWLTGADHGR